jgi:hypothetical protein
MTMVTVPHARDAYEHATPWPDRRPVLMARETA